MTVFFIILGIAGLLWFIPMVLIVGILSWEYGFSTVVFPALQWPLILMGIPTAPRWYRNLLRTAYMNHTRLRTSPAKGEAAEPSAVAQSLLDAGYEHRS